MRRTSSGASRSATSRTTDPRRGAVAGEGAVVAVRARRARGPRPIDEEDDGAIPLDEQVPARPGELRDREEPRAHRLDDPERAVHREVDVGAVVLHDVRLRRRRRPGCSCPRRSWRGRSRRPSRARCLLRGRRRPRPHRIDRGRPRRRSRRSRRRAVVSHGSSSASQLLNSWSTSARMSSMRFCAR